MHQQTPEITVITSPSLDVVSQPCIPPKLPDTTLSETSFKQKLLTPYSSIAGTVNASIEISSNRLQMENNSGGGVDDDDTITLTPEDKNKLHISGKFFVIIKLFGKPMSHQYIKSKLTDLWKVSKELLLIDLGFDYFIVKFLKEGSKLKALHNDPGLSMDFFYQIKNGNLVCSLGDKSYLIDYVGSTTRASRRNL